jgi:hypothetical protein
MKPSISHLFVFAVLLACCCSAAPQSPSIAGDWELIMISPVGKHPMKAMFRLDGEKLQGVIKGEIGETALEGTITEKLVKFAFKVPYQGADLLITLMGDIDGDSMKGTADFGGLAQGDWSGKRPSAGSTSETPGQAPAEEKIDVTGTWAFQVETPMGTGNPTFTFKQEGEKITGQYKGMLGEAEVSGTIKGNAISFSFKVNAQGLEGIVTYSGTVERNAMKGNAKLGDVGGGEFTAKRQ